MKEEAKESEEGGRNRKERRGEEEVGDKMQEHKCNSHKTKSQNEKINKRRHNETMLPCQQHATSQGQTVRLGHRLGAISVTLH